MNTLQGKVALITGSARGIGAGIALALAKEGADIVINHVSASSKARAEEVAKAVQAQGSKALIVQANVASHEDIAMLVQKTVTHFGKIDILVNNSGVAELQPVGGITVESYSKTFDINVLPVIFLSQAVVPHMGDGGRIINISSIVARQGNPGSTSYSASKAAVEAITRVMALELRPKGIQVTAINPGPVSTDMFTSGSTEVQEQVRGLYGVAEVDDIADVVAFLAGPKSRWITGVTVGTNNGVVLN